MNDIQRAFLYSWEDTIVEEISNYLAWLNMKASISEFQRFVNEALDIVNEIARDIPDGVKFFELREYNECCSNRIKAMISCTPCCPG